MPELVEPPLPTQKYDLCAEQMKHVGNILRSPRGAEVRVFRCYECCLVTTERFDSVTGGWTRYEFS